MFEYRKNSFLLLENSIFNVKQEILKSTMSTLFREDALCNTDFSKYNGTVKISNIYFNNNIRF